MFSKMEQAERYHAKLETWSENAMLEGDIEKADKYAKSAGQLFNAIMAIKSRVATKADWSIFNNAVAQRNGLDAALIMRRGF